MLVCTNNDLVPFDYTDSDLQADKDESNSTSRSSGYVFTLFGGVISWV